MKKKLLAIICACTLSLSLAACGQTTEYTENELNYISVCETTATNLTQVCASVAVDQDSATTFVSTYNKEELAYIYNSIFGLEANLGAFDGLLTTYAQMCSDMGGLVGLGTPTSTVSGKTIIVTIPAYGTLCDGEMTFTFTKDLFTRLVEGDCEAHTTFAMKMHEAGTHMGTAGLNTILGMGTVFIMLILISLIIALFEVFGKIGKKKEAPKAVTKTAEAPVQATEDLTDDTELVAVIMAAIRAYEGNGSSDGFVVRSIKKVNRRK